MTKSAASIISFILNPYFIVVFASFLIIYKVTGQLILSLQWTIYSFLFLLTLGLLTVYAVHKGIFTDLDVSKREQRPLLFFFCFIFALLYLLSLYVFQAPFILFVITYGIIAGLVIISIINMKIKASLHAASMSAFIFAVALMYKGFFLLLILLFPIVGWARVKIKRHTIPEIITGGFVGSLLSLGTYLIIKLFLMKKL
jgi:hypothetical protein